MPTDLPAAGSPRALHILDLSGYVFRAYYALPPMSTSKGEPTHAVRGVASMMLKLLGDQNPTHLAVAMDSKEPSFRNERYPEYKANRDAPPPDLSQQMVRCKEMMLAWGFAVYERAGVEADDLIATLTKLARKKGYDVVIVSADKDLLQLVGDGVVMFDSMRDKVFGPAETEEKMGVPPESVRDLLALTGDTSDNVPGVPSVGPKTASKLLKEYGTLDGVYANLDKITGKALKAKLEAHKDDAYLSQELVTLKDDLDVVFEDDALELKAPNDGELAKLFTELEMNRILGQIRAKFGVDAASVADSAGAASGVAGGEAVPPSGGGAVKPTVMDAVSVLTTADEIRAFVAPVAMGGRLALFPVFEDDDALTEAWVGLGVAIQGRAAYVPFAHRALIPPTQLPADEAVTALFGAAKKKAVKYVASDSKALVTACRRLGFDAPAFEFDALLASYLSDPSRRDQGIVALTRAELEVGLETYEEVTNKQRGSQLDFAEVEVERASAYAGRAASAVLALSMTMPSELEIQGVAQLLREVEMPLARVLSRIERTGVRLDLPHLERMAVEVKGEIAALEKKAFEHAGHEFNVNSPRQLETILFDELGMPVIKKTKTARSTDHEVLEELAMTHELPRVILEHRSLAKLLGTYIEALPTQVDPKTGRVHTRFNQAVAATGRLSSSDPGLQNIPIRTDVGRRIRQAFIPADGWSMLSADYSQIELRVLAHLSGDPELTSAFAEDADVHVRTATALFGVKADDVSREQRAAAKTVNFAVIYGQTQFALAKNLGIPQKEAQKYIDAFFNRYQGVRAFMEETVENARKTGLVHTMFGRRRPIADINSTNRNLRMAAERMAGNTPIQGTAADIMKKAMVAIDAEMVAKNMESRMFTVHDELVFEAPDGEKDALAQLVTGTMESVVKLRVPLLVEAGWGKNWDQAH
ncbi:MAG: DNA polymerase I [Polyangiales bacterium]